MKNAFSRALAGLLCGVIFGLGLAVSQMSNPEKVLSFLTLGPGWDPSLLLVMGAALCVTLLGYRWLMPGSPLLDDDFHLPTRRSPDARLIYGATLFGIGWGLGGYCPGPAITSLASGLADPAIFVVALIAGSQLARPPTRGPNPGRPTRANPGSDH